MTIDPAQLVVDPAVIATRLGVAQPSQEQLDRVAEAIWDCQADVSSYLNRDTLIPTKVTLSGIYPMPGFDQASWRAWPDGRKFDDDFEPGTRTQDPDGSWTVEFLVGLNGPGNAAIVRFVTAHATRSIQEDESYGFPLKRVVTNLSAEGQSLTYVARPSEDGAVGSLPKMKTLDRWKRRSAYTRARPGVQLWPNYGTSWVREW